MGRTIILVLIAVSDSLDDRPSMGLSAPCLGIHFFPATKMVLPQITNTCHNAQILMFLLETQTPCCPKDSCLLFCILFSETDDRM